jgi:hypothetical protein
MGASAGERIFESAPRALGPQHSLELPQVPTSTAFALASTTSRGVTHSGQLCALSGVIILCFLSDKSGRNIGSKRFRRGVGSVTSSRLRRKGLSKGRAPMLRRAGCRGLESG